MHGYTVVDQDAKDTLDNTISNCSIPHAGFNSFMMKYISKRWTQQIDKQLHEIHSLVGKTPCFYRQNWKEQIVLTRCRIGHSRLTNIYLLKNKERPKVFCVIPIIPLIMFN